MQAVQVARRPGEALAAVLLLDGAGRQVGVGLARRAAPDPLRTNMVGHRTSAVTTVVESYGGDPRTQRPAARAPPRRRARPRDRRADPGQAAARAGAGAVPHRDRGGTGRDVAGPRQAPVAGRPGHAGGPR